MSKAVLIALVCCIAAVSAVSQSEQLFAEFVSTYNREYDGAQELFRRFAIFEANLRLIDEHNSGNSTYKLGITQFADMTVDEFRTHLNGFRPRQGLTYLRSQNTESLRFPNVDSVDWRAKGAVVPVKNQGSCGSCWAFSTTGSVEGAYFLKFNKLVSFSEQQLVDCSGSEGNLGCNGGLMDSAFEWIIKNGGLCDQASYPYTGRDGTCKKTCKNVENSKISGYTDIAEGDEAGLEAAVAQTPVSIAIEADQAGFQLYKSGVFSGACGTNLDHGVLAVGFDNTFSQKYWIVKNSWGASWGESGYIRLIKGKNQCGLALAASYPKY